MNKILIFIGNLDSGGAERVITTLANKWSNDGIDVTICMTSNHIIKFKLHSQIKIMLLPKSNNILVKIYLLRTIIKNNSSFNIISFLPHINISVLLSSLFLNRNIIISERIHPHFYKKNYIIRFLRFFLYGLCDKIVFQTDDARKSLIYLFKKKSKEFVIANPCDDCFFNSSINYTNKVIINVGRLTAQKRHFLLIDLFSKIYSKHKDWKLLIIGKGELDILLNNYITKLNLTDAVELIDNNIDITNLYNSSSIFCLTSEYEGFPNTLMEAMAIGLPTVSFDCLSGPKDLTNNGENGFLIEMDDHESFLSALDLLMNSEKLRKFIGLKSKSYVLNNYNINIIISKWNKLLYLN